MTRRTGVETDGLAVRIVIRGTVAIDPNRGICGELLAVQWSDVNLPRWTLLVRAVELGRPQNQTLSEKGHVTLRFPTIRARSSADRAPAS